MTYKSIQVTNAEDKIGYHGFWCQSYEIGDVSYFTRSGCLWAGMIDRITKQPYEIEGHNFQNFHDFSGWVQQQKGYRNKENNNRFWSMDKDILIPMNCLYSKDTICFVPQELNNLFLKQDQDKRKFPLGVAWQAERGKYASYITISNKRKFLGRFNSYQEAHRAWQEAKILKVLFVADKYKGLVSESVHKALLERVRMMRQDIVEGKETKA